MSSGSRGFDAPDEIRQAGSGKVEVMALGGANVAKVNFPKGWKWSDDVKPIVKTDTCQGRHLGYAVAGSLHIVAPDGEFDINPGDVYLVEPGHDAWVLGDETFVGLEFQSETAASYAKS